MYCRIVEKETFNSEKNYFNIEKIVVEREASAVENELEEKIAKNESFGFCSILLGVLLAIINAVVFVLLAKYNQNFMYGAINSLLFFIGGFVLAHTYFFKLEQTYKEKLTKYQQEHNDELWSKDIKSIEGHNKEQHKIAEAWRLEHPFEEYIRTCIRDPYSSVAIANAAKYYAEHYLKKEV